MRPLYFMRNVMGSNMALSFLCGAKVIVDGGDNITLGVASLN